MSGFNTLMMGDPLSPNLDKKYLIAGSGSFTPDPKVGGPTQYALGSGFPATGRIDNNDYWRFSDMTSGNVYVYKESSSGPPWTSLIFGGSGTSNTNSGWTSLRIKSLTGTAIDMTFNRTAAAFATSGDLGGGVFERSWSWTSSVPNLSNNSIYMLEWK